MANDPVENAKIKAPPKKQQPQAAPPPPPPPTAPEPEMVGEGEPVEPSHSWRIVSAPRYVSWQGQLVQLKAGQVLHEHVYTKAGIEFLRKHGVVLEPLVVE